MPVSKSLKKSEPLWKGWDWKAQKNGPRHQVYAVNGDCYVGEWKDNMKHGEWGALWAKWRVWGLSQGSSVQSSLRTEGVSPRLLSGVNDDVAGTPRAGALERNSALSS